MISARSHTCTWNSMCMTCCWPKACRRKVFATAVAWRCSTMPPMRRRNVRRCVRCPSRRRRDSRCRRCGGAWAARAGVRELSARPGELLGHVERIEGGTIVGWVLDVARPTQPVELDISADGRPVARVLADRFRIDLQQAQIGTGSCGFVASLPQGAGAIVVRRADDGRTVPLSAPARTALAKGRAKAARRNIRPALGDADRQHDGKAGGAGDGADGHRLLEGKERREPQISCGLDEEIGRPGQCQELEEADDIRAVAEWCPLALFGEFLKSLPWVRARRPRRRWRWRYW